jgi:hypothetical protein
MVIETLQSDKPTDQEGGKVLQPDAVQKDPVNRSKGHMNSVYLLVLKACFEAVIHQQELLSLMASHLKLPASKMLYDWASGKFKQWGNLNRGEWSYLFHGMECDFKNTIDGRFLRIDFGPQGRTDTFTSWGITQFIMCSAAPWSEFQELKLYLAKNCPPYDQFSGSIEKMDLIWNKLEKKGLIEKADQKLLDFATQYTFIGKDGVTHTEFPPGTSEATMVDCAVANRYMLNRQARIQLFGF